MDGPATSRLERAATVLLWAASLSLVGLTILRGAILLPTHGGMNFVSGIWTTLAVDLVDGVFYRPILDEAFGYGGTRYFPLHFALHAGLIKMGMSPIPAGHVIGVVSLAGLVFATYLMLRNLGVSFAIAAPSAGLVLASASAQHAAIAIRGDSLPAALCVLGLALCAKPKPAVVLAALVFTLALAAKISAVYGVAAATAALALSGRQRDAVVLAVLVSAGVLLFALITYFASHGRNFEAFHACSSAGGNPFHVVLGPIKMIFSAVRSDPPGIPLLIAGASALMATFAVSWKELPSVAFLTVAAILGAVFGTPGIGVNHLLDLHVWAIVVFVVAVCRERIPRPFGIIVLALCGIAACAHLTDKLRTYSREAERARWDHVVATVSRLPGPILAEDPLVPLLAGDRPYLLDPFALRVVREGHPLVTADLWKNLESQTFGAVVLYEDFDERTHFGPGFLDKLTQHYSLGPAHSGYSVYLPKRCGEGRSTQVSPQTR